MSHKHSGKDEEARIQEENEALDMKLRGMTDRAIAAQLGVTHTTVQNRIRAALLRTNAYRADEYRTFMETQLDEMYESLRDKIIEGDTKAIDSALRILDRKAKLYGADAPAQLEVTMESEADKEIKALMNIMKNDAQVARELLSTENPSDDTLT